MANSVQGVVIYIGEVQQIGESFVKQEIVLEVAENPTYPEQIVFEFHGQNVNKLNETVEGETVTISYNLRGREWTGAPKDKGRRWFNTLVGWKIDINQSMPIQQAPVYAPPADINSNEDDDLPF